MPSLREFRVKETARAEQCVHLRVQILYLMTVHIQGLQAVLDHEILTLKLNFSFEVGHQSTLSIIVSVVTVSLGI